MRLASLMVLAGGFVLMSFSSVNAQHCDPAKCAYSKDAKACKKDKKSTAYNSKKSEKAKSTAQSKKQKKAAKREESATTVRTVAVAREGAK